MSKGIVLDSKLTPQEEHYAALLAEGMTQTDAYDTVWPSDRLRETTYHMASERARKVRGRVNELVEGYAERSQITKERLTIRVLDDCDSARAEKQFGVAMAGNRLLADMHGHKADVVNAQDLMNGILGLLGELDKAVKAKDISTLDGQSRDVTDDIPG